MSNDVTVALTGNSAVAVVGSFVPGFALALVGVAATCNPATVRRLVACVRRLVKRCYDFIPLLIGNPSTGLLGAQIPNNSPPPFGSY